jgi:hypothetical protein
VHLNFIIGYNSALELFGWIQIILPIVFIKSICLTDKFDFQNTKQCLPQIPLIISLRKEILSSFITAGQPNRKYDSFLNGVDGQVAAKNKVYPIL